MTKAGALALDSNNIDSFSFKRSSGCVSTVLDGETVILDIETGVYCSLNEVGTLVWNTLEKDVVFVNVCSAVVDGFDVESKKCEEDVLSFLQDLAHNKLIEVRVEADS
jgi:hypothetical protein